MGTATNQISTRVECADKVHYTGTTGLTNDLQKKGVTKSYVYLYGGYIKNDSSSIASTKCIKYEDILYELIDGRIYIKSGGNGSATLTTKDATGGTTTTNTSSESGCNVISGATVTITATPDSGYVFDYIIIAYSDNESNISSKSFIWAPTSQTVANNGTYVTVYFKKTGTGGTGGTGGGGGGTTSGDNQKKPAGFYYNDFTRLAPYYNTIIANSSDRIIPLIWPYPNNIYSNDSSIAGLNIIDITPNEIYTYFSDYCTEFSHFICSWDSAENVTYKEQIVTNNFFNGDYVECFSEIRELGFLGYDIQSPTFFTGGDCLQLIDAGAGYSPVFMSPEGNKYAVTGSCQNDTEYYNWYNANSCETGYNIYNISGNDMTIVFWWDNAPVGWGTSGELDGGYWRKNAFSPRYMIENRRSSIIIASDTKTPIETYDGTMFSTSQKISEDIINNAQENKNAYSSEIVPYIFNLFDTVIKRFTTITSGSLREFTDDGRISDIPVKFNDNNTNYAVVIDLGVSMDYYYAFKALTKENFVVAFTLCTFQKLDADGYAPTDSNLLRDPTGYKLYNACTVFDYGDKSSCVKNETDGTACLLFALSENESDTYWSETTASGDYGTVIECFMKDNFAGFNNFASSLYITVAESADFNNILSSFRVDMGPCCNQAIFYSIWQHEYNTLLFG